MNIRQLFYCIYDPEKFHCVHFVILAAKVIFEKDYTPCFLGLTGPLQETIKTSRNTVHRNKQIKGPKDGCIVLMTYLDQSSHVGLFFQGRIFHLIERGPQRITVEQAESIFNRIRYYEPNLCLQELTEQE
ncbi:hypothetical protein IC789_09170 [Acinetobacter seifertii]|uniref:Uncharacterized protein n=1 Tax=Acinetobacter seifertii TaxID=1530123 RepID=A0A7H2RKW6_9GAMM|nr:hypothetical protein [Acinetobacter seifertii]MBD1224933.1 hypothetical protein [Acinetobacter seifertii]MBD1229795.1 hypothetical protein [Acinetobacter seifertii]QNX10697.1 hypothetical protein IC794_10910 [Acinetobacter seifertii]QNX27999.1 hypothetical protein IC791_08965 [Acinetobacter seifertii]QNX39050.1 hypothetical protein IC789_09170 [Acinetobacter seifertii]